MLQVIDIHIGPGEANFCRTVPLRLLGPKRTHVLCHVATGKQLSKLWLCWVNKHYFSRCRRQRQRVETLDVKTDYGADAEKCSWALTSPKPIKPESTAPGPTWPRSKDAKTRNVKLGGNRSHVVNQGRRTGARGWLTG
ncbi:hypothetical protein ACFE04_022261 [Oxalis oulophora]